MKYRRTTTNAKLVALGGAIRKARTAKGLSAAQLAVRCELSRHYLSRIERGQVPVRILTVLRIARALGVSGARLFRAAKL